MIQSICIHGRQPALGRAEIESLLGRYTMRPIGNIASGLDHPTDKIPFDRLGGTVKLAKVLTILPTIDFLELIDYIIKTIPEHLAYIPEGKIKFGLSVYGLATNPANLNKANLRIKKVIKHAGRSIRVVPNKELALNSAQVLHNQLTGSTGMELLLIRNGQQTFLAQTTAVQDITAYAKRDQARPKRDAKIGMLPPKLAQIIINLSGAKFGAKLLDPFCGTGVILQEASLMGMDVWGSDLDARMITYAEANLEWLFRQRDVSIDGDLSMQYNLQVADATRHKWSDFQVIACETYLGRPFSSQPNPDVLKEVIQDVNTIHKKFLKSVAEQTSTGFRMCVAVPTWKTKQGFQHLPVLDSLEGLGYNRQEFVHAKNEDLIYHRENQIVGRELLVLIRK